MDRDTVGEASSNNCTTIMKKETRNNKSEPKVTEINKSTPMRKNVSYINIRGVHVIFIQSSDVPPTSEKSPDNQEEINNLTKKVSFNTVSLYDASYLPHIHDSDERAFLI